MNLYRSFGSMLETWVAEGYPAVDSPGPPGTAVVLDGDVDVEVDGGEAVVPGSQTSDAYRSGSRDSLRFSGTTARSESEDSGVELVSASSTWTSQQHSMALMALQASDAGESTEPDAGQLTASGGDHHRRPPTCPSSPALSSRSCPSSPSSTSSSSSSSSCQSIGSNLSPLSAVDSPSGLRIEQALRRADPTRRQLPRRGLSLTTTRSGQTAPPRKRSNTASSGTTCSSTGPQESRGQRSPPTPEAQAAGDRLQDDPDSRPATQLSNGLQAQTHAPSTPVTSRLQAQAAGAGEEGWAELSPGFLYLEQVCLMLEKFAQLQTHHHDLQAEIEQLRNQQNHNMQHSTQCLSLLTTESVSHRLEDTGTQVDEETLLPEEHAILAELRRRSVSDAGRLTPYRNRRGRSKSIGDLLEEDEEEIGALRTAACEGQEQGKSVRPGGGAAKSFKQKIASLRRNEDVPDGSLQTLPRLGKKTSLRGLKQFFKKRSKSSPTPT
ncbi:uncharacterized protein si:dkey-106l3.7 [Sardina pilchardus]|uniref:uncharacterized protein si:dkey-106l3.7 n=1 Tax=Sardina pilchardus TaxID=27697 RepID=UPI002E0E5B0C